MLVRFAEQDTGPNLQTGKGTQPLALAAGSERS